VSIPKTCATCAHRIGFGAYAHCAYTGEYAILARKYKTCPPDFSPWQPRQGVLWRVIQLFTGCAAQQATKEQA
jgi:hypothetical protein